MAAPESAQEAYDHYASVYDETNAQNDYEMWLGRALLPELEKHGLRKDWALDVGCGTGRAFDPLLERGWRVVGCDVSAGMLAEAERKFGSRVPVFESDARSLPAVAPTEGGPSGEAFSLILLLNDVINYMTEDGDLERVFAGVEKNLSRDQGLVVFDANTLGLFRHSFTSGVEEEREGGWGWRGLSEEAKPGMVYEARLSAPGVETQTHRQRHWKAEQIEAALEASGLRPLAVLGQSEGDEGVSLTAPPDEERDVKIIYIAARGSRE